jgi:hypothetical protein
MKTSMTVRINHGFTNHIHAPLNRQIRGSVYKKIDDMIYHSTCLKIVDFDEDCFNAIRAGLKRDMEK